MTLISTDRDGLYVQENSKIYLLKQNRSFSSRPLPHLNVSGKSAIFGGGVYVADNSTVGDLQC